MSDEPKRTPDFADQIKEKKRLREMAYQQELTKLRELHPLRNSEEKPTLYGSDITFNCWGTSMNTDDRWRELRLNQVFGYASALCPQQNVKTILDIKGNLIVVWKSIPTFSARKAWESAWEAVNEDPGCVSHEVRSDMSEVVDEYA